MPNGEHPIVEVVLTQETCNRASTHRYKEVGGPPSSPSSKAAHVQGKEIVQKDGAH